MFEFFRSTLIDKLPPPLFNALVDTVNRFNGLRVSQINRIKKLIEEKPLILAVETISVCNARCVFCAYPGMKRKHEVMPLDIFEKIVKDYSALGGGALSLTPVMGDLLLDPHFLERYTILAKYDNIRQISFTTNGIAFAKFSDEQIRAIIQKTFLLQFSIGGLDEATYKKLYQVDKFNEVKSAVDRILRLKKECGDQMHVLLAFRTNNPNFEKDFQKELEEYRAQKVFISHIFTYHNYGGEVTSTEVKIKMNRIIAKKLPCAIPLVHAHALSNGRVTNCGCTDANGNGLVIGDSHQESVAKIWSSEKRQKLLESFPLGKIPKLCQQCTAYRPMTYLGATHFHQVKAGHPLPIEFYIKYFGG